MKDGGLEEVSNPSELFLAERPQRSTGSVVVSSLEGTRPILVELQARCPGRIIPCQSEWPTAWKPTVSLLLAVMEKRLGMHLGTM